MLKVLNLLEHQRARRSSLEVVALDFRRAQIALVERVRRPAHRGARGGNARSASAQRPGLERRGPSASAGRARAGRGRANSYAAAGICGGRTAPRRHLIEPLAVTGRVSHPAVMVLCSGATAFFKYPSGS